MNETNDKTKPDEREFILQWHITNACEYDCKHCYMTREERKKSVKTELTTAEAKSTIDKLTETANSFGIRPRINFTGGNPLIRTDIYNILTYAKNEGCIVNILGNPVDAAVAKKLVDAGVTRYQLSFDGLKATHDSLRGTGHFDKSLHSLNVLKTAGIDTVVMATVTKMNASEIIPLSAHVLENGANRFDFARLVPEGNGKALEMLMFSPDEYRTFLNSTHEEYKKMIRKGIPKKAFGTKDPLWSLLLYEKGELVNPPDDDLIYGGCSIARNGFCMDCDGTIYACRRMPLGIGNIKDIADIRKWFVFDEKMNEYRNYDEIENCSGCQIQPVCNGCRAVAFAVSGSYFGKDPQCWRKR